MDWNKFARDVHPTAVENGLWDKPRSFDDVICKCLVHLGRAYEDHISGRPNYYHLCVASGDKRNPCEWDLQKPCPLSTGELACEHRDPKPEGVAVELGECVLRLLDCAAQRKFSVEVLPAYADTDFTSFICSVSWQLVCAHQAVSVKDSLVRWHINQAISLILTWARQNSVDMESILLELHACEKARAGRREGGCNG